MGGKRYAVLVGNGSFTEAGKDAPRLPALRCPAADVAGLRDLLGQPTHGAYAVTTLIDRPHNEIQRALYDCLKKAGPEDQVMIYYSGHGKLDEQGNLYLAGSDTDPESLDPTALAAADVQKYVGESRAGARIVILDCCFSGAVERIFRHGTAKGEIAEQAGQALRTQAGQGVFYLTASTDVQTAEEKDQDHYSLLTKHIITGIGGGAADANDDGEVRFSELCDFVQNGVRQEGAQRPLSFAFKAYGDPIIALTGREPLAARCEVIERQLYALRAKKLLHGPDVARILDYIHGPGAEPAMIQALHAACADDAAFLRTLHRLPDRTRMPAAAAPDPAREPSAAPNAFASLTLATETVTPIEAKASSPMHQARRPSRAKKSSPKQPIPDDVEVKVWAMVLAGRTPPPEWCPLILTLELPFSNFSDLSLLAGLTALQRLDLSNTQVSDLSLLAGLTALQHLDLSCTQVSDLSPLADLTALQHLRLHNTQVSDLSPLADLTALQHLDFHHTQVSDLSSLADLTALQHLDFRGTHVSDLSPLAGLTALRHIDLGNTQVSDLSPLADLTALQRIDLGATQVSDLALLADLTALQHLDFHGTQLSDLSPLADLTALQHIDLSITQVSDLSPLADLTALQHIDLSNTQVSDLSPLADLTALQHLDLSCTQVSDLSPLAGLTALQHLNLDTTQVSDLSPLADLTALQHLRLDTTQVSDLSPLAALTALQHLYLDDTCFSGAAPMSLLRRANRHFSRLRKS